jgi:tetratricopeptide (TPR) repeat protein
MPRALLTGARLAEEGKYGEALRSLDRASLDRFYRHRRGRAYAEAFATAYRGIALYLSGRGGEALPHLLQAERDVVWPRERIWVLRSLGHLSLAEWCFDEGLRYSTAAVDLILAQPRLTPELTDHLVGALLDQAACSFRLGRTDEAMALNERAYAVVQADTVLPADAVAMLAACCLTDRAMQLERLDRWEETMTAARLAMAVGWRLPGEVVLKVLLAEAMLGSALSALGRREEALEVRLRLLDSGKAYAESHRQPAFLADLLIDVAESLTECGRVGEAWRYLDSAPDILEPQCGGDSAVGHVRAAEHGVRALMLEVVGDAVGALDAVEECLRSGHGSLRPNQQVPGLLMRAAAQRDRLTEGRIDKCELVR